MPPYKRHVFICTNRRPDSDPRGSCAAKGSEALKDAFKDALKKRGMAKQIRANAAGCLDTCAQGCSIVVYPEGVWYGHVTPGDVEEIVDKHLVNGEPVERLRMKFPSATADATKKPE